MKHHKSIEEEIEQRVNAIIAYAVNGGGAELEREKKYQVGALARLIRRKEKDARIDELEWAVENAIEGIVTDAYIKDKLKRLIN